MHPITKPQALADDPMSIMMLVISYIDENPRLYHEHIRRQTDILLQKFPSKIVVALFAQAAADYTDACNKLLATTDNLACHDLSNTQITAIASSLIQNKESAWKRYNQARLQVMSSRTFQTRPLGKLPTPPTNW